MTGFQKARVEKIIRDAGAFRVSADAVNKLNEILTERGIQIAKHAVEIAELCKRKTVQNEDIKLAASKF